MSSLRFGTDGVRGLAGVELTPEGVVSLGRAAGLELARPGDSFLVGRDTRRSGPMLVAALAAGLAAEGVDVVDLGVAPTPAVAALAVERNLPAAVVSASHNGFADNGIKLFAAGGTKLSEAAERSLEDRLATRGHGSGRSGAGVGRVSRDPDGLTWYRRSVLKALDGRRLDGLRVVVDCAHGAATVTAAEVLVAAGADVVSVVGADPDGSNINEGCGSTDPRLLAAEVLRSGADAGVAFDGDADRLVAVDGTGRVVDGDRLIALCATDLCRRGRLSEDTVVVTVMTNLGFHQAMEAAGIAVHQTPVGDRHVVEALARGGWSLGGEQSGHLVFPGLATTGDGLLSALVVLDVVARSGSSLAELAGSAMQQLPQVLRNVEVADRDGLAGADQVWAAVAAAEAGLGGRGRVLLRASGTERLVRVMVEGPSEAEAVAVADRLVAVVRGALG